MAWNNTTTNYTNMCLLEHASNNNHDRCHLHNTTTNRRWTMKQKIAERDRDDLVAMAMSQGKITPAQKDWADEYALKDPAGFKVYVAKAAVVVPLDKIKISEEDKTGAIGEQTLVVAKMMGISKETLEKYGTA